MYVCIYMCVCKRKLHAHGLLSSDWLTTLGRKELVREVGFAPVGDLSNFVIFLQSNRLFVSPTSLCSHTDSSRSELDYFIIK